MSSPNRTLRVMHVISGDLWAGAEVQAFTLLQHLQKHTLLQVVILNEGELASRLRQSGISVSILPEQELNAVSIIFALIKEIAKFKPDILHTHRQKENILGSIANLLTISIRLKFTASLRTVHGAPEFAPTKKQRLQTWLDHLVGKYLQKAIIAVSAPLGDQLKRIYPANKVHVIQNGVDQELLKSQVGPVEFCDETDGYKHIGIIGRIEPVKRIDIFLDMAKILLNTAPDTLRLKFHIIGDGSLKSDMQAIATEQGLNDHVLFHGHRQDIASCIAALDVIVMCSDHEGTPMTALEACALGTPLVAHKTGGLIDILGEMQVLLVEKHMPEGYAEVVKKILVDSSLIVTLNEKFSAENNGRLTASLYHDLLFHNQ